jgi:hypothetical protein
VTFFHFDQSGVAAAPQQPGEDPLVALRRAVNKGTPVKLADEIVAIYIDGHFSNVAVVLDNRYFYHSTFEDCTVVYNGGPFYLDSTSVVAGNTFLVVGDQVARDDRLKALESGHTWAPFSPDSLYKWHPPLLLSPAGSAR